MPARKPSGLNRRHDTAADRAQRASDEAAMRPAQVLPMAAPARLEGHDVAAATWRRVMRIYADMEAEIVTRLDQDLLIDYCILVEQATELDTMRKTMYAVWQTCAQAWEKLKPDASATERMDMGIKLQAAMKDAVALDGRADRKRALLLQLRQSLYLTPRARAGVAPAKKEAAPPPDDLEQLLNDVDNYVNGAP